MTTATLQVGGMGWVLPAGVGSGLDILQTAASTSAAAAENSALDGFSAKPYLSSVKGYLDPASSFCLAASSLALRGVEAAAPTTTGLRERSGICSLTRYGATLSGFRFYEQFLRKGPRLASPLIFPHGYANTAGNLAAIEFEFGGPHMVFYGAQDVREGFEFAAARLADGSAAEMVVTAYESADPEVLPDGTPVLHGAIALLLVAQPTGTPLWSIEMNALREVADVSPAGGTVSAMLRLLAALVRA